MKRRISAGFILVLIAAAVTAAAVLLYGKVMYTQDKVRYFMYGAIALAALDAVIALVAGYRTILGAVPVINSVLCALAGIFGAELMANQLGYVYAGLDGMDTIQNWIVYTAVIAAAMLLNIIAAFMKQAKDA